MVTAGNGLMTFRGLSSGKSYQVSFYSSDVVGAYLTFSYNGLAVAGSQTFINAPEDVLLVDVSFTSTNTVSTAWVAQSGDVNTGNVLGIAIYLSTLALRPAPNIGWAKGRKITFVQA